jgi:hypothetical protein
LWLHPLSTALDDRQAFFLLLALSIGVAILFRLFFLILVVHLLVAIRLLALVDKLTLGAYRLFIGLSYLSTSASLF